MTTETRIGIVAGLLIVVAASVYFFYGSERDEDGVLVASPTRVTIPPKIPVSAEKKTSPRRVTRQPVRVPSASGPLANNFSQRRPPIRPVAPPGPAAPVRIENNSPVKQPDSPVALRSGPSNELVEATWENLLNHEKPAAHGSRSPGTDGAAMPAPAMPAPALPVQAPRGAPRVVSQPPINVSVPSPAPKLSALPPPAARPILPPMTTTPKQHTVSAGDTLSDISKQYYGDRSHAAEILAANPRIKSARSLKIGDVLTLPEVKSETGRATSPPAVESPSARSTAASESASPAATSGKTYTVQSGDTLYSIAKKHCGSSSRWKEIQHLNQDVLKGNSRLSVGMTLKLPE